jgi:uncharacterized protein (DUF58 family)
MLTRRGATVLGAGVAMWMMSRLVGSPGLEVVGIGLAVLPLIAAVFVHRGRQRLELRRRLSDVRVPPGTRVTVSIDVENRSTAPTAVLLIEDRIPAALGRPARLVISGIRARATQRVSYTVVPQMRGRYPLGPLTVNVSDPFALHRQRIEFSEREELLVTPEVEDLTAASDPTFGSSVGSSRARQLFRTGEEYYTMRQYQEGDDLRRIHWASVARTGQLMIRQDESSRRANGLIFLDNRAAALGRARSVAFERSVSVAATLGMLLLRHGFLVRWATADAAPASAGEERFLDALAGVDHSRETTIGSTLRHLRAGASTDTTLVFISGPPALSELPSLLRSAAGFGPKLAVLIYPVDPDTLPVDRQAELEGRATQARLSLTRAGWDCIVLPPSMRLIDRWQVPKERPLVRSV